MSIPACSEKFIWNKIPLATKESFFPGSFDQVLPKALFPIVKSAVNAQMCREIGLPSQPPAHTLSPGKAIPDAVQAKTHEGFHVCVPRARAG